MALNDSNVGTYYGLTVPHQMWRGLGLQVQPYTNSPARIEAGYYRSDAKEDYIIEVLERAKAHTGPEATDEQIVRTAITLRADDRLAAGLSALGAGLAQMPREMHVRVAHQIAGAVALLQAPADAE